MSIVVLYSMENSIKLSRTIYQFNIKFFINIVIVCNTISSNDYNMDIFYLVFRSSHTQKFKQIFTIYFYKLLKLHHTKYVKVNIFSSRIVFNLSNKYFLSVIILSKYINIVFISYLVIKYIYSDTISL